jgi:nucleoid-associated protein YgaU
VRHASELLADGDALVETLALVLAVVIGGWHVIGVVVCAAARARPQRRAWTTLRRWCPPLARRVVGGTASLAVVFGPVAAHAETPPAGGTAEPPFVRAPADATEAPVPNAPAPPDPTPRSPTPDGPAAREPTMTVANHVVVPGDNLWRIAAAEVARRAGGAEPTDAAIVMYWRAVIAANRATLRSGDPSLILPGEIVTLPPS